MNNHEIQTLRARLRILEQVVQDLYIRIDRLESGGGKRLHLEVTQAAPAKSSLPLRAKGDQTPLKIESFIRTYIEQHGRPPTYQEIALQMRYVSDSPQESTDHRSLSRIRIVSAA